VINLPPGGIQPNGREKFTEKMDKFMDKMDKFMEKNGQNG